MTRTPARFGFASIASILLLGCALGVTACSDGDRGPGGSERGTEDTGSIGLDLDVGPNVHVNTISYDISGNGFHKTGSLNVSHSRTIKATIGGIPAGSGYVLTLRGVDTTDSRIECLGTATFNIVAGATTTARVPLQCALPRGNGSVGIVGTTNVCPRIDSLSAEPSEATVGNTLSLSAAVTDSDHLPAPASYAWRSSGGQLSAAGTPSPTFTCTAAGDFTVTLDVTDGECTDSVSTTVTCSPGDAPPPPPLVKINEIESNLGVPGDWVELFNAGTTPVDLSGFVFRDNDDTHTYTIPAGTTLAPGAYRVLEEAAIVFGLGSADSARLFMPGGTILVDSYTWTAHAATTYGRCPNGTGAFTTTVSATKGAANECPGVVTTAAWPGANNVQTVDGTSLFGSNLSGLTYQGASGGSPAVLWAVRNGPGTLYRLVQTGGLWMPDTSNDWGLGKALHYVDGTGNPDSESVTRAEADQPFQYVATERNNDASTISRPAILRVDTSAAGVGLTATNEWNLVADLPVVGANLGLEAITWIPDSFLVANSFFDEFAAHLYNPAEYPNHGTGLFFVGLEANGLIYAYALDHVAGTFRRIATIASGHPGMMGIEFDREVGYLWAACDDTCQGQVSVLRIDTVPTSATFGRFIVRRNFDRPTTMPNLNNEGIAFAPESECVGGQKAFFWSDDGETGGHSIRRDTIPCGSFF